MASYLEHVGYRVQDLDWYVNFFAQVYEMPVEKQRTNPDGTREVWLTGGLQLAEDPNFTGADGRAHHVCLLVDDLEAVREKALAAGCRAAAKHHWVILPDGLQIEMFAAAEGAVAAMKAMPKRK